MRGSTSWQSYASSRTLEHICRKMSHLSEDTLTPCSCPNSMAQAVMHCNPYTTHCVESAPPDKVDCHLETRPRSSYMHKRRPRHTSLPAKRLTRQLANGIVHTELFCPCNHASSLSTLTKMFGDTALFQSVSQSSYARTF